MEVEAAVWADLAEPRLHKQVAVGGSKEGLVATEAPWRQGRDATARPDLERQPPRL